MERTCETCGQTKDVVEFCKGTSYKHCKRCRNRQQRIKYLGSEEAADAAIAKDDFRTSMNAKGLSWCSGHKDWLPNDRFGLCNSSKTKCHGYCKECQKVSFKKWRTQDPVKRLYHSTMRGRRLKRGERIIEFTVTLEYLRELWAESGGRCAVSGHPFDTTFEKKKNPFSPSLDRIDSSQGYIPGNVRFVCNCINLALNEWGEELYFKMAAMSLGVPIPTPRSLR